MPGVRGRDTQMPLSRILAYHLDACTNTAGRTLALPETVCLPPLSRLPRRETWLCRLYLLCGSAPATTFRRRTVSEIRRFGARVNGQFLRLLPRERRDHVENHAANRWVFYL